MYGNGNNATYFDSFGVKYVPKEIQKFIIQTNDSIICGYFCIGFVDFMLKGKSLLDYTNLFSPNKYDKIKKLKKTKTHTQDKIIPKYFQ